MMKASRLVLLCEARNLVVTRVDFDDSDGLALDARVLDAAGFVENEKVDVQITNSGTRFACRLRASPTAGELSVTGASAYLVKPGDTLALSSFGWMKGKAALKHQPNVVIAGAENAVPERTPKPGKKQKKEKERDAESESES